MFWFPFFLHKAAALPNALVSVDDCKFLPRDKDYVRCSPFFFTLSPLIRREALSLTGRASNELLAASSFQNALSQFSRRRLVGRRRQDILDLAFFPFKLVDFGLSHFFPLGRWKTRNSFSAAAAPTSFLKTAFPTPSPFETGNEDGFRTSMGK